MNIIASCIFVLLGIVAVLHAAWAMGVVWPADDESALTRAVIGTPDATKLPSRGLNLIVALLIFLAAVWPIAWRGILPYPHIVPQTLIWLGMWVLAFIFLVRGTVGLTPLMGQTEQPFASFNRRYYSPLCILLGLGFLALVLEPVF